MRLCDDTIAVIRAAHDPGTGKDLWESQTVEGVSWYGDMAVQVDDRGLKAAPKIVIRIPEESAPAGFSIKAGDLVARSPAWEDGRVPAPPVLKKTAELVTVLGVTDNRRAPNAPHWKVVCS